MLCQISGFLGECVLGISPVRELVEVAGDSSDLVLKISEDRKELVESSAVNEGS